MSRSQALPNQRLGPRPLALHLALAGGLWLGAVGALPAARSRLIDWNRDLAGRARAIEPALAAADPGALGRAVADEARHRFERMLAGIRGYRAHPYRRAEPDHAIAWQQGTTRLLDCAPAGDHRRPLLLVPSLVNRAYILDLAPRRSLVRFLARRGFRPLLVDWGAPGPAERDFALADYLARLEVMVDMVARRHNRRVAVIGYCMGGTLAVALAQRRRRLLSTLVLLAAPWDFHLEQDHAGHAMRLLRPAIEAILDHAGELPVDVLQSFFALAQPTQAAVKFADFGALDPSSAKAQAFVQVEDWLNDGVPLAAKAARECLFGWYGDNAPANGRWRIGRAFVRPERMTLPSLVVVPRRDRIVPRSAAMPLAEAIPGAKVLTPRSGHIGMVVGRHARADLWRPLADWLDRHA